MNQRNAFPRWLFYAGAAILLLLLQSLVLNRLRIWGVHPFLPPMMVAVAASWEDRQESLWAAAVFGVICDLTLHPPIPCFYTVLFTAAAFLSGLIAAHWIASVFFCAAVTSMVALLLDGAFHILILTYRGVSDLGAAALILGRELLLTLPLLPLVYFLFRPIHRRFPAD